MQISEDQKNSLIPNQNQQQAYSNDVQQSRKRQRNNQYDSSNFGQPQKRSQLQTDKTSQNIFLYKPGVQLPSLFNFNNQNIKVIIAYQYLKKTNPQLLKRNIYGNQTYTANSDMVCIALHSGFLPSLSPQGNKKYQAIQLTLRVIKPKKNYLGATKNGITSRTIKGYNGNALKVQAIRNIQSLSSLGPLQNYAANMCIPIGRTRVRARPKSMSGVVPVPESHIVFNSLCQPAHHYSLLTLCDRGFEKNQFVRKRVQNGCLILQTDKSDRYQLSKNPHSQDNGIQGYRFGRIRESQKFDNQYFSNGQVPIDANQLDVMFNNLPFQQIAWSNQGMIVGGMSIGKLTSFKFYRKNGK